MRKLGRGTTCGVFVQNLVLQALEEDCKWLTSLAGEVSIFWMWVVPGHSQSLSQSPRPYGLANTLHQNNRCILVPLLGKFLYSHWADKCLFLWFKYNWASKEGKTVGTKKKWRKDSLVWWAEGWLREAERPSLCLLVMEGANYLFPWWLSFGGFSA